MCWYSSQTALSNLHIKFPDFTPLEFKAGCKKKRRVQRWCSALGDTDRYSLFWGDTSVNCQLFGRWKSRVPPTVFRDTSRLAPDRTALINLLLVYQCITHVDMAQKYSNVPFTKGLKRPNIYIYIPNVQLHGYPRIPFCIIWSTGIAQVPNDRQKMGGGTVGKGFLTRNPIFKLFVGWITSPAP